VTGHPSTRTKPTARTIAKALGKAGYAAEAADHELAVKIRDADGNEICTVWLPIGEPTPTGMGDLYLWGKTGDEHQAPDFTGVNDLVQLVTGTLQ
jgi:hypothetical protein